MNTQINARLSQAQQTKIWSSSLINASSSFELPEAGRSIDLEAFSQAVGASTCRDLEKYSDVASFGAIQAESKEIAFSESRIMASGVSPADALPILENAPSLSTLAIRKSNLRQFFLPGTRSGYFRVGEIKGLTAVAAEEKVKGGCHLIAKNAAVVCGIRAFC